MTCWMWRVGGDDVVVGSINKRPSRELQPTTVSGRKFRHETNVENTTPMLGGMERV